MFSAQNNDFNCLFRKYLAFNMRALLTFLTRVHSLITHVQLKFFIKYLNIIQDEVFSNESSKLVFQVIESVFDDKIEPKYDVDIYKACDIRYNSAFDFIFFNASKLIKN